MNFIIQLKNSKKHYEIMPKLPIENFHISEHIDFSFLSVRLEEFFSQVQIDFLLVPVNFLPVQTDVLSKQIGFFCISFLCFKAVCLQKFFSFFFPLTLANNSLGGIFVWKSKNP